MLIASQKLPTNFREERGENFENSIVKNKLSTTLVPTLFPTLIVTSHAELFVNEIVIWFQQTFITGRKSVIIHAILFRLIL